MMVTNLPRRRQISALKDVLTLADRFAIISFDLFDTLIERRGLSYDDIQFLSAHTLSRNLNQQRLDAPETVRHYRHHTTNILRDSISLGSREPTLDKVMARMLAGLGRPFAVRRPDALRAAVRELAESLTRSAGPADAT